MALFQFTPVVKDWPSIKALATPTPKIAPIKVCELEAGKPNYHVPKFQMMAANSKANTMANNTCVLPEANKSIGNRFTMA